ncbi:assimilatory nitrate reductase (NADH) alpha subunit apoprotein [Citreicella sp. 357]|nr:assimilatory nitrate reductase (NADH) alpha subunit apoprotein [Citreicella sp. 357]
MKDQSFPEIRSTCPYCGVGCGVRLRADGNGGLDVRGDPDHPANFGKLCSKGSALGETVGLDGRLLSPRIHGRDASWDEALELVADRFRDTVARHGPDSVAFYVSGQLLTEDYYVANKLMKGYIGSANIDTNSRLCMASSVAGHKRAFGTDTVPGTYEDLEEADLVVLVGSNLAWCHPVLHQRILAAREARGTRLVVIDPRRTASCDGADMHLGLAAGSDAALFNGLLSAIDAAGAIDDDFSAHITGMQDAIAAAALDDDAATGLTRAQLDAFYKLWIGSRRVVTVYSQGVNQSTSGTDKVNAIVNCHLATGRIGLPGTGPFSVTGQPNAMGGREVGGLANTLACHLDLENPDHRAAVHQFWDSPVIADTPGKKAVDMFRAVGDGRIRALWIIHTNPAVTMPDADAVRDAIAGCDFVVVSDITAQTDTARLAHVLLPATAWGEKDGTVTNSDRTISRQRTALPAPGDTRPDWDIIAEIGRRMGHAAAFDYASPAEIFREYAALSGVAGALGRDFDISGKAELGDSGYKTMAPFRWPFTQGRQGGRFFADGQFYHDGGKGRMIPVRHRAPGSTPTADTPFRLNTGRIRDQWHTMTRTALSPRLSAHLAEPYLEIHPTDAARLHISPADLVHLHSPHGRAILRARLTDAVQPGDVFAPMHWTGETAPAARIDALVAPLTDPVSGQPESKASVVSVARFDPAWYGFAVSSQPLSPDSAYWARARTRTGWRAEMADATLPQDWENYARGLFDLPQAQAQVMLDARRGRARIAFHHDGKLLAALFAGPEPVALKREFLATLPGTAAPDALTGHPPADRPDPGPLVCSCFNVGLNTILAAIEDQHLMSVEAIGTALEAGANCGSCRPELAGILASALSKEAAE